MAGVRATLQGEIRSVRMSEDGKFVDLAVLQDGSVDSVKLWGFADAFDGTEPEVGQHVEVDFYASMKLSKKGNQYLSVQAKQVRQAGAKLRKAS